jgi:hypothetical protein
VCVVAPAPLAAQTALSQSLVLSGSLPNGTFGALQPLFPAEGSGRSPTYDPHGQRRDRRQRERGDNRPYDESAIHARTVRDAVEGRVSGGQVGSSPQDGLGTLPRRPSHFQAEREL